MKIKCSYKKKCLVHKVDCDMCIRNSQYTHFMPNDYYESDECTGCSDDRRWETCEDPICQIINQRWSDTILCDMGGNQ